MLALSPPLFSNNINGFWPLEEALLGHFEHNNSYFYGDHNLGQASSSIQSLSLNNYFPAPAPSDHDLDNHQRLRSEPALTDSSGDVNTVVKKLNHNASERDRRKKINQLYFSLRNLLPASDHSKKLSIPATVSKVLKYIPELQQEVEGLLRKREALLSKINSSEESNFQVKQEIINSEIKRTSLSSISASQLNSREIAVQMSTYKAENISNLLHNFENDGLSVLNASSFESIGGRVFHNLHLQVEGSYSGVKCRTLGSKLNP